MCQIVKIKPKFYYMLYSNKMKKEIKNILIFGATAQMAHRLIEILLNDGINVYAVSRKELNLENRNLHKFNSDLTIEDNINKIFNSIEVKFDYIINFQGVAISSPVEKLDKIELEKQLDISLFSLLYVLKNAKNRLNKNGIILNISSMAAFGIFPFLSPYSIAKASSDILLNSFEIETGIKTVSIKPGVVGTKFWKFSVDENKENFNKFEGEYREIGEFLKENALKNSNRGLKPEYVSKFIYKILYSNNIKSSYLVGIDSYFTSFASNFKGRILFDIIRKVLNLRIKRQNNGK